MTDVGPHDDWEAIAIQIYKLSCQNGYEAQIAHSPYSVWIGTLWTATECQWPARFCGDDPEGPAPGAGQACCGRAKTTCFQNELWLFVSAFIYLE